MVDWMDKYGGWRERKGGQVRHSGGLEEDFLQFSFREISEINPCKPNQKNSSFSTLHRVETFNFFLCPISIPQDPEQWQQSDTNSGVTGC